MTSATVEILDAAEVRRTLTRLASEIIEHHPDLSRVVLLGIRTRGVPLAHRLADQIQRLESGAFGAESADSSSTPGTAPEFAAPHIDVGALDITFYRDDLERLHMRTPRPSDLPCDITDRQVILVDDVIYSGRTIRAALEAVNGFGRPELVRLAVLIDRGHRQLPVHPDYVGKQLPTSLSESIRVHVTEIDGKDRVFLKRAEAI
ncbi:bifunctional pyr operon transcriptional regulator/uracil phosphoribosyltransferase PyrR [Synechococcus sp. PCC 7336]|uniref:bifunctional pyr operon transcriptional regulator/uracil phosphoribosyltransferase PyrR n=1 Tax=Synechococcus sp. PCC 7336 TaxID=195250 RepID=UPI0003494CA9|nr:bifunctional pyr operon transcriptional regulator/uracil phosphoribosyltransferase PyrR [Synechococcus sp. PCC 7336]